MSSIVVDPEIQKPTDEPQKVEAPIAGDNPPEGEEIPEKYRGKSAKELIEMHRNAESEIGRARNEIGSVRRLADELIGIRREELARTANPPTPAKPITANDLLDNPEDTVATVARRVAEERTTEIDRRTQALEARLATEEFEKRHPGFQDTMQTPEFAEFVRGSTFRQKLALTASKGDYAAADELFSLYKERAAFKATPAQTPSDEKATGVAAARKAGLAKPGGSSAAGVVPGNDGKPRFTRTELLKMRINNPEEFDQRQAEILDAYREGRVR